MDQLLLTPSTHEESVWFLFRPLAENSYLEIKLRINFAKELINTSHNLSPNEANFLREKFFHRETQIKESILNFRETDIYLTEKTYSSRL